jgi:hypothetical protein
MLQSNRWGRQVGRADRARPFHLHSAGSNAYLSLEHEFKLQSRDLTASMNRVVLLHRRGSLIIVDGHVESEVGHALSQSFSRTNGLDLLTLIDTSLPHGKCLDFSPAGKVQSVAS